MKATSCTAAFFFSATLVAAADPPAISVAQTAQQFSEAASNPILPPLLPWNGKSRALVVPQNDPWITPAEKSDFRIPPSYDDTAAGLRKLAAAPPQLKMILPRK